MNTDFYTEIGERLELILSDSDIYKLNNYLRQFGGIDGRCGEFGGVIVKKPLVEIVSKFESGEMRKAIFMRKLQQHLEWGSIFSEAIKRGVDLKKRIGNHKIYNLKKIFLREIGVGQQITLEQLLTKAEIEKKAKIYDSGFIDITSSHILVTLSEILFDIENDIESYLDNSAELIKAQKYEKLYLLVDKIDSNIKDSFKRNIEMHKLFKPLFDDANVFVSIVPILQMMFDEKHENMEKVEIDCRNIFDEFFQGAELQRVTMSLKLKVKKKWDLEELEVNVKTISKIFKKIADDINFRVISQLRKMKSQGIFDLKLFNQAKKLGIDFTGLNSTFGVAQPPDHYHDMIMEVNQSFSSIFIKFSQLLSKKTNEETEIEYKPNLHTLYEFSSEIRRRIEKNYLTVPIHFAPLYAGSLLYIIENIIEFHESISPFEFKHLKQHLVEEYQKKKFYKKIERLFNKLSVNYEFFEDLMNLGKEMVLTDQNLALDFIIHANDESMYKTAFLEMFEKSVKRLEQMLVMNTINQEIANAFNRKIATSNLTMQEFTSKWSVEELQRILSKSAELGKL